MLINEPTSWSDTRGKLSSWFQVIHWIQWFRIQTTTRPTTTVCRGSEWGFLRGRIKQRARDENQKGAAQFGEQRVPGVGPPPPGGQSQSTQRDERRSTAELFSFFFFFLMFLFFFIFPRIKTPKISSWASGMKQTVKYLQTHRHMESGTPYNIALKKMLFWLWNVLHKWNNCCFSFSV